MAGKAARRRSTRRHLLDVRLRRQAGDDDRYRRDRDRHRDRRDGPHRQQQDATLRSARCLPERGRARTSLARHVHPDRGIDVGRARRQRIERDGLERPIDTFEGTTDDTATLGAITQAYTHHEKFHRSTTTDGDETTSDGEYTVATTGISDGVPAPIAEGSGTVGGWSGAPTDVKGSGGVTPAMIGQITGSAGYDFVTINPAYRHAQEVWRDTRCMIVTAPSYIPMSAFANNAKPTHTEEVDKGSTTSSMSGSTIGTARPCRRSRSWPSWMVRSRSTPRPSRNHPGA